MVDILFLALGAGALALFGAYAKALRRLVDYAVERERAGATAAMVTGMLPSAFALGESSGFSQPMAVAVIGGLLAATLLSLLLTPVIYELVDDFEQRLRPKLLRLVTSRGSPVRAPAS